MPQRIQAPLNTDLSLIISREEHCVVPWKTRRDGMRQKNSWGKIEGKKKKQVHDLAEDTERRRIARTMHPCGHVIPLSQQLIWMNFMWFLHISAPISLDSWKILLINESSTETWSCIKLSRSANLSDWAHIEKFVFADALRSHLSQGQTDTSHCWCLADFCQLFQITNYSHLWLFLASAPAEHPCPLTLTKCAHMATVPM